MGRARGPLRGALPGPRHRVHVAGQVEAPRATLHGSSTWPSATSQSSTRPAADQVHEPAQPARARARPLSATSQGRGLGRYRRTGSPIFLDGLPNSWDAASALVRAREAWEAGLGRFRRTGSPTPREPAADQVTIQSSTSQSSYPAGAAGPGDIEGARAGARGPGDDSEHEPSRRDPVTTQGSLQSSSSSSQTSQRAPYRWERRLRARRRSGISPIPVQQRVVVVGSRQT